MEQAGHDKAMYRLIKITGLPRDFLNKNSGGWGLLLPSVGNFDAIVEYSLH